VPSYEINRRSKRNKGVFGEARVGENNRQREDNGERNEKSPTWAVSAQNMK
jgi:hypothetical protein